MMEKLDRRGNFKRIIIGFTITFLINSELLFSSSFPAGKIIYLNSDFSITSISFTNHKIRKETIDLGYTSAKKINFPKGIRIQYSILPSISVFPKNDLVIYPRECEINIYKKFSRKIESKTYYEFVLHSMKNKKERVIFQEDKVIFMPSVSPDGKKIAYLEEKIQFREYILKVLYLNEKYRVVKKEKFIDNGSESYPCWLPDSKHLLIPSCNNKIYLIDLEKKNKKEIAEGYSVCCSPDGKKIAFASGKNIYIADIYGRNKKLIVRHFTFFEIGNFSNLQWSPDGKYIAYNGDPLLTLFLFSYSGRPTNLIVCPVERKSIFFRKFVVLKDYTAHFFRWIKDLNY